MKRIYIRDRKVDIVIPKQLTLREMVRKYLSTGELPELLSQPTESFDFDSPEKVTFEGDFKRTSDLSDFIHRDESPMTEPSPVSTDPSQAPIEPLNSAEPATPHGAAPSPDLTNGAD